MNGSFHTWRSDSQAMVLVSSSDGSAILYSLANRATRPLEANSGSYVWEHSAET